MDQCRSRLKLSENFERHWSIPFPGEIHMDQSLVHTFSWGNSYGPMVLKVLLKFPPTLVLVHGWLLPDRFQESTELPDAMDILGKSQWGLSNGGLRPLSAISAQSSTIVHFCGPFDPFLIKNLLMPLFLMGCFPRDFEEGNGPLRPSAKRPIKEGKRPINANGQFSGTPPWRKTAPLKRPIKRSMI